MENVIHAFKGFNKDMTCRGMQYEEGKEYVFPGDIKCCNNGGHACEYPLDIFSYYPPATSVYYCVEASGEIDKRKNEDSKIAAGKLKIGAKIDIAGLVKASIEYTKSNTTHEIFDPDKATAGNHGAATAGDRGAATAGDCGAAIAGDCGVVTAGNRGAAIAGDCGVVTAGNRGAAIAGDCGVVTAGEYGAATAGEYGAATSKGKSSVGRNGLAVARGNGVKVKGGTGSILVVCEENEDNHEIKEWIAVQVDGEKVKADTWYKLVNGKLVECK